jgi:hypothetical protein
LNSCLSFDCEEYFYFYFSSSVHDGVFRQYTGERSLKNLKKYIDHQDWQKAEPLSSYFGPNSIPYVLIIHFYFYFFLSFSEECH